MDDGHPAHITVPGHNSSDLEQSRARSRPTLRPCVRFIAWPSRLAASSLFLIHLRQPVRGPPSSSSSSTKRLASKSRQNRVAKTLEPCGATGSLVARARSRPRQVGCLWPGARLSRTPYLCVAALKLSLKCDIARRLARTTTASSDARPDCYYRP